MSGTAYLVDKMLDKCRECREKLDSIEKKHPILYVFKKEYRVILNRWGAYINQCERLDKPKGELQ